MQRRISAPTLRDADGIVHLRAGGTSVVIDTTTGTVPAIVHWGPDLGDAPADELAGLARGIRPQRASGGLDDPALLTLLPQPGHGWLGTPALEAHRASGAFAHRLELVDARPASPAGLLIRLGDAASRLELTVEIELSDAGLLRQRLAVTNVGDDALHLQSLLAAFPLPHDQVELFDTTGHHLRERAPQRHAFTNGTHLRESRRGRPGADATLLLCAGVPGFGFERGAVHGVHMGWSGSHRLLAERTPGHDPVLLAGEVLLPGEIVLAPGVTHVAPWVVGSWGDGLTALSARFHDELRARPTHPRRPRPVTLNTWEAVYFDHDLARLTALAEAAARVGVERFVLDDGWFRHRRDDTAGLGDWFVDADVWPNGLHPLLDRVRELGMEFGLWFEPEMVNPDSDLAREHPDWILRGRDELPPVARQQQVLDLANPAAFDHLAARLDALLDEYDIAYIKWDHNRDLVEPGAGPGTAARGHRNVEAVYRLLDGVRQRHPRLEIESCASGGARVDLGILERTDRIWVSDCIDPLERLVTQKHTGLLVPPELMGAHISTPRIHSTKRHTSLDFSAGVALLGHLGIEWDVTALDEGELTALAAWVERWKGLRDLVASGRVVHADLADPALDVRGVVAADGARALMTVACVATSAAHPFGRVRFPGLDARRRYRVEALAPLDPAAEPAPSPLAWLQDPVVLSGAALGATGVRAPMMLPQSIVALTLTAVG
ncbi:alpha-galactosidase [Schumannella sp. 10F1B-5-1]|uniref:alpha-galactosidase n=1 Tax=Schumannella sp. 10F1B-5-1 TaxID=2590780 RepID=UPI00113138A7|nr:alpha-galactosidase [Schumannella sp. 10F1B-5-1]TPW71068.1 alpha-galactosidase [Schumannella sp. 10F1B-5-1]